MRRTLYLDMDGVVADFEGYAKEALNLDQTYHDWPPELWEKLKQNPRMYANLRKMPGADPLVNVCTSMCEARNWNLLFLTAVPRRNDVPWAFHDKTVWAQTHYPHIPVHFGPFRQDKPKHLKPGDILIDDRETNIKEWTAAGGVGILHTLASTTIITLRELV